MIFSVQSIRWHSVTSGDLLHQGKAVNATDFAPRYKWRWCYYFKANEQLIVQPGYVGSMQTNAAPAGLLLRSRQWCIYARSERCHCTASKELFDARHGTLTDPRAARIAALQGMEGGLATPNDSLKYRLRARAHRVRPSLPAFRSLLSPHRSNLTRASLPLRIVRERPCETA